MGTGELWMGDFVRRGSWSAQSGQLPQEAITSGCFPLAWRSWPSRVFLVKELYNSVEKMSIQYQNFNLYLRLGIQYSAYYGFVMNYLPVVLCVEYLMSLWWLQSFERRFNYEDWTVIQVWLCWWFCNMTTVLGVGGKWDLDEDMGPWDFCIAWDPALLPVCLKEATVSHRSSNWRNILSITVQQS